MGDWSRKAKDLDYYYFQTNRLTLGSPLKIYPNLFKCM